MRESRLGCETDCVLEAEWESQMGTNSAFSLVLKMEIERL